MSLARFAAEDEYAGLADADAWPRIPDLDLYIPGTWMRSRPWKLALECEPRR